MDEALKKIHPNPEESRWDVRSREIVLKTKWNTFVHDSGVTDKGKPFNYYYVDKRTSVAIIAITENNELILINQYRYTINAVQFELPAGGGNEVDDPKVTAFNELNEETGYTPGELKKIAQFFPYMSGNEISHVFLATGCKKNSEQNLDDTELGMKVVLKPVQEVLKMSESGEITDGYSLAALNLARPYLAEY